MRQPSSVRSARVARLAASEPVPGSVSPKQPSASPEHRLGQPLRLLLVAAPALDRGAHERGLHRDHGAHGRVGPADLLDDQRVGAVVDAAPAVLLGDDRSEVAHLGQHLDELEVESLVAVVLADARNDLLVGELAGGFAYQPLLVREFEADHGLLILHDAGGGGRRGGKLGLRGGRRDRPRALRAAGARRRQPVRGRAGLGRPAVRDHGRQGHPTRPGGLLEGAARAGGGGRRSAASGASGARPRVRRRARRPASARADRAPRGPDPAAARSARADRSASSSCCRWPPTWRRLCTTCTRRAGSTSTPSRTTS